MEDLGKCDVNYNITGSDASAIEPVTDLPEDIPHLHTLYLYLSDSCNLRCKHCWITPTYINGEPSPGEIIDVNHLENVVRETKTMGLRGAKLTGGEPMLHPAFEEIALMLTNNGLMITMETNGTLINKENAHFMYNKTNINFISISLDSPTEIDHDEFRGLDGAFNAALNGLKCLVDAGYKNVQVIMSLHKNNMDNVTEMIELVKSNGATSLKLNPITNNGRGKLMHQNDEALSFAEVMRVYEMIQVELKGKTDIPVFLSVPLSMRPISEVTKPGGAVGDCGIDHIIGILGSGDVALCGIGRTMPEFIYGNIAKDSIRDIWLKHPSVVKLRHELRDFDNYPELCRNCIYMRKCRTNCVVQNYSDFGKLIWPNYICLEAEERGLFKNSRKRK